MSMQWPPAQRLLPLATGVVAAHMLLLQVRVDPEVAPANMTVRPFATREVAAAPPATAPPATAPPPPVTAVPEAAAPPATPRPRGTSAAAPEPPPAPPPSDADVGPITPPAPPAPPRTAAPAGLQLRLAAIPEPARLRYVAELTRNGQVTRGDAEFQWRHDGTQYEARWALSGPAGIGRREQSSTGRLAAEGLAPLRFADRSSREEAVHFERDAGKVTFSNNRPQADLAAGAQDRLSVIVQLAALLGGDPKAYPAGTVIAIPTASTRDAEVWQFNVAGEELLQLPGGARTAVKLQRAPRKEFDYTLELWLAPNMDYAPVRLRLTYPNGDSLDQRWSSTDKG
jgi:hypothetical protein